VPFVVKFFRNFVLQVKYIKENYILEYTSKKITLKNRKAGRQEFKIN